MKNADKPVYPTTVGSPEDSIKGWHQTAEMDAIYHGLTKREYFAALAMQGTLSNPEAMEIVTSKYDGDLNKAWGLLAKNSVKLADHILAELEKQPNEPKL